MVTRHLEKASVRVEREGKSWTISRTLQNLEIQYLFKKHFRGNSRGYDLNRNFPDFFKPNTKRTQPETDAVKDWISKIQFLLSGSLHGGALVCTEKNFSRLDLFIQFLWSSLCSAHSYRLLLECACIKSTLSRFELNYLSIN